MEISRRGFLGMSIAALAAEAAELSPLHRVYSFPSVIRIARPAGVVLTLDDLNRVTARWFTPGIPDTYFKTSPLFDILNSTAQGSSGFFARKYANTRFQG